MRTGLGKDTESFWTFSHFHSFPDFFFFMILFVNILTVNQESTIIPLFYPVLVLLWKLELCGAT